MNIVQPSYRVLRATPDLEELIEYCGRKAWKSEDRISPGTAERFINDVCFKKKHQSILEHGAITVEIICDRGVSHELVRHRFLSPTQESTRFCNYGGGKFGGEITVVDLATGFRYDLASPKDALKYAIWQEAMADAERHYMRMLAAGAKPQEARSVLPNSTKTELAATTNPREWLHIFSLRTSHDAHPQMAQIMGPLEQEFAQRWPAIFGPPA